MILHSATQHGNHSPFGVVVSMLGASWSIMENMQQPCGFALNSSSRSSGHYLCWSQLQPAYIEMCVRRAWQHWQLRHSPAMLGWSSDTQRPGPRFNIKMSSYQYRKSHCGDKTVVRSSYHHNGISYIGKMSSLHWIRPWTKWKTKKCRQLFYLHFKGNFFILNQISL